MLTEDPTITPEEARRITTDINHIFSSVHLKIISEEHQEYLEYEGLALRHPEPLHQFLPVQNDNSDKYFLITNSISNAYREAFDFLTENKVNLLAVDTLLSKVESGTDDIDSLLIITGSRRVVPENMAPALLKELSQSVIKRPSILSYQFDDIRGTEELIAYTIFYDTADGKVGNVGDIGVINIDGTWKLLIGLP